MIHLTILLLITHGNIQTKNALTITFQGSHALSWTIDCTMPKVISQKILKFPRINLTLDASNISISIKLC